MTYNLEQHLADIAAAPISSYEIHVERKVKGNTVIDMCPSVIADTIVSLNESSDLRVERFQGDVLACHVQVFVLERKNCGRFLTLSFRKYRTEMMWSAPIGKASAYSVARIPVTATVDDIMDSVRACFRSQVA